MGNLRFDGLNPTFFMVGCNMLRCYSLKGKMKADMKSKILMNCSYLRNDLSKHNNLKEMPVDKTIEVLTIGTGNYNQVLHLDLSGFSKLKELTIGDYSFRNCVSFKCQGLDSLVKIVIGKDCFCDMESSFFDLEDEYYSDDGRDENDDEYDEYDDNEEGEDDYDEYDEYDENDYDDYDEYDDGEESEGGENDNRRDEEGEEYDYDEYDGYDEEYDSDDFNGIEIEDVDLLNDSMGGSDHDLTDGEESFCEVLFYV